MFLCEHYFDSGRQLLQSNTFGVDTKRELWHSYGQGSERAGSRLEICQVQPSKGLLVWHKVQAGAHGPKHADHGWLQSI